MKELADSLGVSYPRVLIFGDANEGGEPEKNQVSVGYFRDHSGGCFFDPDPTRCPTEDEVADFDNDGLADMQVARLPVTDAWKVAIAVENFLNKVSMEPTNRAVFTLGDEEWQGISSEGLPELMEELKAEFIANGYEVRYMKESDEPLRLMRELAMADTLNEGVDIVINTGTVSNRSRIGGDFIQKVDSPVWDMDWLTDDGPRPFVFFGPGCDMADFDRDNPVRDPILAEMFLCNDPMKPAAVAWISHGRGNWSSWHKVFAREFVAWLFSGEARDLLDCFWLAKRACWQRYPGMRNYLRSLFYLGWPVKIPGVCESGIDDGRRDESGGRYGLWVDESPAVRRVQVGFELPQHQHVTLSVYDVLGRMVVRLIDDGYSAGKHKVVWTGLDSGGKCVAPGLYFLYLRAGDYERVEKVIYLR